MDNFSHSFESTIFLLQKENIKLWSDLEATQLDHGEAFYLDQQLFLDGIFFDHSFISRKMENRGTSPSDEMWFFHIGGEDKTEPLFLNGKFIENNEITIHKPYTEFYAVRPNNHSSFGIGVTEEILDKFFSLHGIINFRNKFSKRINILIEPSSMKFIRLLLFKLSDELKTTNITFSTDAYEKYLHIKMVELLSTIIGAIKNSSKFLQPKKNNQVIVDVSQYVNEHKIKKLSIQEICDELGHSQRTINYNFNKYYGLSAKKYINFVKLNNIKNELLQKRKEHTKIFEVASQYGYWHMGQFSKDYKELFNELPKKTLEREIY